MLQFFIAVVALVAAIMYFTNNKKDPRLPPGPPQLPIIGNAHQLLGQPAITMMNWAKKYGPVYCIKSGGDNMIILNDPKMIKDVYGDQSSTGRTPNPLFLAFSDGNHGVIMSEGAHWEAQRRFTLRKLRDFGFAKSAMEGMILEEANSLVAWFGKRLNQSITGNRLFNGPVVNSLWNIISGERSEWDGPKPPAILNAAEEFVDSLSVAVKSGLLFIPFLRHIAPDFFGWTGWIKAIAGMNALTNKSIEEHKKKLNKDSPEDFIDHFLIEKEEATDPTSSFYKHIGDKNLTALIPDLFLAGSETTSHTLSWSLLFLAHNPKVQEKLQKELDNVLGDRLPSIADRPSMPYTEATILELLRKPAVVNNGVPHRMMQDAEFGGYLFPKGTVVISNIFWVHNDPKIWGDPENFRPERFLSKDETKVVKHDALVPFSLGKRQCLGKSLAEDSLFIFLACLFQKYTIKPDPNCSGDALKEENILPNTNLVNAPGPFKIIVSLRKK